jgi:hypothetical protein
VVARETPKAAEDAGCGEAEGDPAEEAAGAVVAERDMVERLVSPEST